MHRATTPFAFSPIRDAKVDKLYASVTTPARSQSDIIVAWYGVLGRIGLTRRSCMIESHDSQDAPYQQSDLAAPRTWPGSRVLVRRGSPTGARPHLPSSKYYTLRYAINAFLA